MNKRYYIRLCKKEDDVGHLCCGRDGFYQFLGRYRSPKGDYYNVLTLISYTFSPGEIEEILMEIDDSFRFDPMIRESFFHTSTGKSVTIEVSEKNDWRSTALSHIQKWDKIREEEGN